LSEIRRMLDPTARPTERMAGAAYAWADAMLKERSR
jgi:hypothetical protein